MPVVVNCKSEKSYIQRNRTIDVYFNEIRKYPVLTAKEERKLIKLIKEGTAQESKEARDKLINCNQRFVVSVSRKWYNGDNIMDVIEEANIGLMTAIDKYSLDKDERFLTYAIFWIRKAINNYIINKQPMVRPSNANKLYTYVNKVRSEFYNKNERFPSPEELKYILKKKHNIVMNDTNEMAQFDVFSMDEYVGGETSDNVAANAKVQDVLYRFSNNDVEEGHDIEHVKTFVKKLLSSLTEREKYVICGYYGIDREQESMDVMALKLGVCKERIRQIYGDAIKKLKKKKNNPFINKK